MKNTFLIILILTTFFSFSQETKINKSEEQVENGKIENGKYKCNLFDWEINIPKDFSVMSREKSKELKDESYNEFKGKTDGQKITSISNTLISFEKNRFNFFYATFEPLKNTKRVTLEEHKTFVSKSLENEYSGKIKYDVATSNLKLRNHDFYKIMIRLYQPKTDKLILTQIFYTSYINDHVFSVTITFQEENIGYVLEHNFIESFQ